jgi:hypothetical protein
MQQLALDSQHLGDAPTLVAADLASAGTPVAATPIRNRVALAEAMALGLGVIENARTIPVQRRPARMCQCRTQTALPSWVKDSSSKPSIRVRRDNPV